MTRDDWVNWQFAIKDRVDKNIEIYVLRSKLNYDLQDGERGWVASYVEKLSDETWSFELDSEDAFCFSSIVTKWCEENCQGRWNPQDPIWWEFELEEDAMAFKLRWGD